MIIHLKKNVSAAQAAVLASEHKAFHVSNNQEILITGSGVKELPTGLADFTDNFWVFANDMQLASKNYQSDKRTVAINNTIIGGTTNNTVLIGGPCSVEVIPFKPFLPFKPFSPSTALLPLRPVGPFGPCVPVGPIIFIG